MKPRSISDLNVILAGKKQRQKSNPIANLNLFLKGDNTDHGHDRRGNRIQQDTSSTSKSVLIPSTALKEPSDCNVVAKREETNTDSYKVPSSSSPVSSVSTSTSDKKSAGNHRPGLLVHKNLETESHGSSKAKKKLTLSELNGPLTDKKQNQKSNPTATMYLFLKGDHLSNDNDVDVDIIHLKSSKMSKSAPSPSFSLKDPNDSDGTVNADSPKLSSSTPHAPSSASSVVVLPLKKSSGSHQADVPVHEISELMSSNAQTDTSGQVKKCVNQNYDTDLNISPTGKGYPKEASSIIVLNLPLQSSNDHQGARLNHDVLRIEKNAPNYSQKNLDGGEIIYRRNSETRKNVPIESLKLYLSPSMASFIMTNQGKSNNHQTQEEPRIGLDEKRGEHQIGISHDAKSHELQFMATGTCDNNNGSCQHCDILCSCSEDAIEVETKTEAITTTACEGLLQDDVDTTEKDQEHFVESQSQDKVTSSKETTLNGKNLQAHKGQAAVEYSTRNAQNTNDTHAQEIRLNAQPSPSVVDDTSEPWIMQGSTASFETKQVDIEFADDPSYVNLPSLSAKSLSTLTIVDSDTTPGSRKINNQEISMERFDLTASNDHDHEGDIIQHDTSKMSKTVPSPSIEWTDPSDSDGTTMPEDANIDSHKVHSSSSPVSYVATSDSDKKSAGDHRPNLLMHAKLETEPRYYEGKKINTNENIRYAGRIDIPNATHQGTKTTSRRSIHSSQEIHWAHPSKVNSSDSDISSEENDAKLLSFPILGKASALLIDQAYIESYLFKVLERNQSDITIDVASFLINDARGKNNNVDTNLSLVLQITRVLLTAMGFDHNSPKSVCHSFAPIRPLQKKTTERASAVKHIVCLQIAILKASTEERKCSLMEEIALAYRMACHFMLVSVEALLEYHRTDPRKTRSLTKLKMRATLTMVVSLRDLLAGLMKNHTSPNAREVKGCAVNDNISNFFSCEPGQSFNGAEILVVDCVGLLIESECENKMKDTKRTMKVAETLLKLGKAGSKSLVICDGIMEFLFRRILIQEVENKVPGLPLQRYLLRLRNRYDAKTGALASTLCQMTPTCRRTLEDITLLRQNQSSLIRVREEFIGQSCNNHCSPPPVLDPMENTDAIAKREIEILRIEGCMYLAQVIDVYNATSGTSRNAGLAVSSQHVSNMAFYFFHTLMENDPQYYKSEAISIRLRVNLEPAVLSSLYLATKVIDCAINMTDIIQFSKQVSQANAIFSDKVFPERRPYRKLIKKYEQHLMILHSYYVPGIDIIPISKISDVSEYLGLDHRNDSRFKHVFNNIGYTFSTSCLIDDPLLVAFAVYHFGSEHLNVLERYHCWNDLFENESKLRIEVISSHMNSIFTRYQGSHCNSKENLSSTPELMQDITPLKVTLEEMDTL